MAGRQTDKYGNPAHHTGHLGAPGTTGAVETSDPLGAPGSTGASPTITGYGQEQLHRPAAGVGAAHHLPLHGTGSTDQGYAYGTAASMGHAGHARVGVPQTTGGYETGTHTTDRTGGHVGGYDTGSFGGGNDIGYTRGVGRRGDEGRHGGGCDYDTGGDKGRTGGIGQRGHEGGQGGDYDFGGGRTHDQGLEGQGFGGNDTGAGRTHGQDLGVGDWAHSEGVKSQGGGRDTGACDTVTGSGYLGRGGVNATVVEVEVSEEPLQEERGKGIIDRLTEHLPGAGGGTK